MSLSFWTNVASVVLATSWVYASGAPALNIQPSFRPALFYIASTSAILTLVFHWVHVTNPPAFEVEVAQTFLRITLLISTFAWLLMQTKRVNWVQRCFQTVFLTTSLTWISLVANLII